MKRFRLEKVLKVILLVAVATLVLGFVVKGLWNWLMPPIFGLHAIGFWQAIGLLLLGKLLFGGFRGPGGHGRHWRHRMQERWEAMTPEEREKFRQRMQKRCGGRFVPPTPPAPEGTSH